MPVVLQRFCILLRCHFKVCCVFLVVHKDVAMLCSVINGRKGNYDEVSEGQYSVVLTKSNAKLELRIFLSGLNDIFERFSFFCKFT